MSNNHKPEDSPETEAGMGEAVPQSLADEASKLKARNDELEGQIKDLTDRLLRAHADMDNFRKRTEREKEETAKYAISKFARDLVGVGDNFQRAVAAVPPGAVEADPALKSLVDGVQMTEREFLKSLEKNGVLRVDPAGQAFNPHQHQAVMERNDPSVPSGTVLDVFQPGYLLEGRCLRPAMVVVSTGGPKPGKGPNGNGAGAASDEDPPVA